MHRLTIWCKCPRLQKFNRVHFMCSYIKKSKMLDEWVLRDDLHEQFLHGKFALMINHQPLLVPSCSSGYTNLKIMALPVIESYLKEYGFMVSLDNAILLDVDVDSSGDLRAMFAMCCSLQSEMENSPSNSLDKVLYEIGHSLNGEFYDVRRAILSLKSHHDRYLLAKMFYLHTWNREFKWCSKCGSSLKLSASKALAKCATCKTEFYPPVNAAIMCLVVNRENTHALLIHSHRSLSTVYTAIAGFLQPGESLADAVHREVAEEVGVKCGDVRQLDVSQFWPFRYPSILCAFHAVADMSKDIDICKREVLAARWFSRAEIRRALDNTLDNSKKFENPQSGSESRLNFKHIPFAGTISHLIIENWVENT